MSNPVKLYVYDLSNGLARQMSLSLTGKQIDGIWHTSVVVFGKEVFYGQGITITEPGRSHHGQPLQAVDMGATEIDEGTFWDYVEEIRQHYTADKYHLLDFNCNSFTNDCVGFLTGGSIPSWIKDLPTDFLSTPFGAALRPTIDQMYRRPTNGQSIPVPSPLQSIASQAAGPSYPQPTISGPLNSGSSTVAGPLKLCTNSSSFNSLLKSHKAVCACFTSPKTCPPCRVIEPVFEDLARANANDGVAFVKIDMDTGLASELARSWNISATPTFIFFLNGKKYHELKGADAGELRAQVDLLVYQAFPPHPHTNLDLPAIRSVSLAPILFTQVPPLASVQAKLAMFIDDSGTLNSQKKNSIKRNLSETVVPFLRSAVQEKKVPQPDAVQQFCMTWNLATDYILDGLSLDQLFPAADLWRVALLNDQVASWCASNPGNGIQRILVEVGSSGSDPTDTPRSVLLVILRMFSNAFSKPALAQSIVHSQKGTTQKRGPINSSFMAFMVNALLHPDASVRTAAASLAFNVSVFNHKNLRDLEATNGRGHIAPNQDTGEWETEMVTALVEAIRRETSSEDTVHRLTAALALLLYLSPFYSTHTKSLLEAVEVRDILLSKLRGGHEGFGGTGLQKTEVKKLVEEVAKELCP